MTDGWLYFLREGAEGAVKIGWTQADPEGRRRQQQTGNSAELVLLGQVRAAYLADACWQTRFQDHHKRGEWFRPAPELLEAIAAAVSHVPEPTRRPPRPQTHADVRRWMARHGLNTISFALQLGFAPSYVRERLTPRSTFTGPLAAAIERATDGEITAAALLASPRSSTARLLPAHSAKVRQ